jgi:hypothetical protein
MKEIIIRDFKTFSTYSSDLLQLPKTAHNFIAKEGHGFDIKLSYDYVVNDREFNDYKIIYRLVTKDENDGHLYYLGNLHDFDIYLYNLDGEKEKEKEDKRKKHVQRLVEDIEDHIQGLDNLNIEFLDIWIKKAKEFDLL